MNNRERFILTLEVLPDPTDWRDGHYRLKGLLKVALRRYGLRNVGLRVEPADAGDANQRQGEGNDDHNTNSRTSGRKALR